MPNDTNWSEIIDNLSVSPMIKKLLKNIDNKGVVNDSLHLVLSDKFSHFLNPQVEQKISDALSEFYDGIEIKINLGKVYATLEQENRLKDKNTTQQMNKEINQDSVFQSLKDTFPNLKISKISKRSN